MTMTITTVLIVAIQLMAPLALAVYGEMLAERAGVLNVGLEGAILIGALGAAVGYSTSGNAFVGIVVGLLVGLALGFLLAYLYVSRRVDQIVGGIVINLLAVGLTTTLWVRFQGTEPVANLPRVAIPMLSEIPIVGPAIFNQNLLVYIALVAAPVVALVLGRTRWGVRAVVAGEAPAALAAAGVSVRRTRTIGIVAGTMLGALGGVTLLLTSSSGAFVTNMSNGLGFIALALVILARGNPLYGLLAAIGFGVLQALQYQVQAWPWLADIPIQAILAIPYVVAIAVVALNRTARYPAATGVAWEGR